MIEKKFDIPFVAAMALREKQIQQIYRPIIAVHKWFARRPGTLFRSLLLSEFSQGSLYDAYFRANNLEGLHIADPFMGGGTPLLEANRLGCDVTGYDINPMAYWIVRQEIEHLDLPTYREAANELISRLKVDIDRYYRTTCLCCGDQDALVKYFLWVKTKTCEKCDHTIDLFSGYLLAENERHPKNIFVCPTCGELTEAHDRKSSGTCRVCSTRLTQVGPAKRSHCVCPHCQTINRYPTPKAGPPQHRMFAIEYHCAQCKPQHQGRFFKKPDHDDLSKYAQAEATWLQTEPIYVPDEAIPKGDETDRLLKWGYKNYSDLFNKRQLLGLELSCRLIMDQVDERVRNALATNLSDLLRYQNMLCRYDTMALKSLDIFSVHGFPVGLIQCESNLLGIAGSSAGANIGSGGWTNIVDKYAKAKLYCDHPFEWRQQHKNKEFVPIRGEWIGDQRNGAYPPEKRQVTLCCQSATSADIAPASLDAVFTDPPYFGNVQYAELMDFCYVWLRRLVGHTTPAFHRTSTRDVNELTGNVTMGKGLSHFTEGVAHVFSRMGQALKPGAPLAFTYHHNTLEAYYPIGVAILDAGLTCTASIPCPAEMGGSIHINGTGSSIIDTVFVCRSTGRIARRLIVERAEQIANLVHEDLEQLRQGNVKPTQGDIRCITYGHFIRLAIWRLRQSWQRDRPTSEKLAMIADSVRAMGGLQAVESHLKSDMLEAPKLQWMAAQDTKVSYGSDNDDILF